MFSIHRWRVSVCVSVSGPGGWLRMGGWELHHYEVKVYCRETQLSSGQGGTFMFCWLTLDDTFARFSISLYIYFHSNLQKCFETRQKKMSYFNIQTQFVPTRREFMSCVNCNLSTCRGRVMDIFRGIAPCSYPEIIISKRHSNGTHSRNISSYKYHW